MNVFVTAGPFVYTPGSVLLFAGKLPLLLLAYIREDAETVRQPIYGLLIGNLLIIGLLVLISRQPPAPGAEVTTAMVVIASSAWLSVWGTFLLFVGCIAMIILYERLSRHRRLPLYARLLISTGLVLVFDHLAFFAVLDFAVGVPISAATGSLVGKMVAAVIFCGALWAYLRFAERAGPQDSQSISDVFNVLTYRQRFEALNIESRTDVLTGARNRLALRDEGPQCVADAIMGGSALGLLVIDIDHFKGVNDQYGHLVGDTALRFLTEQMKATLRDTDRVYRIGGDEFLILLPRCAENASEAVADTILAAARTARMPMAPYTLSISVGWADLGRDGFSLEELTMNADRRLYEAKASRSARTTQL
ncbi:diguanylate cyclase [Acuticoccus sp. MNP-M23]|nr:diguanylate cyclase [Acuticoccus sp. MNP-M23]WMS44000.1 diguanylate cyclase [Acuticoccus sp. MNP-M23]